jgi:hypothetical protein
LVKIAGNSIQEITFEIGMLVQYGLDINEPRESHVLRALPEMDIGVRPAQPLPQRGPDVRQLPRPSCRQATRAQLPRRKLESYER